MLVTLDTSHFDTSPLNLSAPGRGLKCASRNNRLISVTADTCQDPIGPCGPQAHSAGDFFRHFAMAAWSSAFDFSVRPVVWHYDRVHTVGTG